MGWKRATGLQPTKKIFSLRFEKQKRLFCQPVRRNSLKSSLADVFLKTGSLKDDYPKVDYSRTNFFKDTDPILN